MRKLKSAIIIIIAFLFIISGCMAESGEKIIFGTFYNIQIKGASSRKHIKTIDKLFTEIENQVSTSIDTSDVAKINNSAVGTPIPIGKHTKELFLKSLELYEQTENAFNAAIFPLVELWKFSPDTYKATVTSIPTEQEINEILPICRMQNFDYDSQKQTITKLHKNAKLDFGGIAKGYAIDLAKELCSDNDDALINVGGNIITFGSNKKIGLTHPRDTSNLFGIIHLQNKAIATSGDYERFYILKNARYNHIIAKDGYPTGINNNDIISVCVIGASALMCDALSTSVMIQGINWAQNNLPKKGYSCIVITTKTYKIIGDIHFESQQDSHKKI